MATAPDDVLNKQRESIVSRTKVRAVLRVPGVLGKVMPARSMGGGNTTGVFASSQCAASAKIGFEPE